MRGLLLYQPGRDSWFVHPAIRREFPERADREQRLTALRWYEDRGAAEGSPGVLSGGG